jgi:hypothetical protein
MDRNRWSGTSTVRMREVPEPRLQRGRQARQRGRLVLKARYVRVTTQGRILIACGSCGSELERLPATGRLVLCTRKASAASSSGSSGNGPPAG